MVVHAGSPCVRWSLFVVILATLSFPVFAQDVNPARPVAKGLWTLKEARTQLRMYPKDVFLQYVALKLGQREGIDATELIGSNDPTQRQMADQRRQGVDLFNLFSGSLAVQESLQLDAMRPGSSVNGPDGSTNSEATIEVAKLTGPTVSSHPWHDMLKGQQPKFSVLANYVPADQYYIRFKSVSRMLDVIDGGNLFTKHLYTQSGEQGFARDTEQRLRTQLAVETNSLSRPFYDLVVKEIAITGSDPFVNEGSDVTLLFGYEQDVVFQTQMNAYLAAAEKETAKVTRREEVWEGIPFVHLTSPNRVVHVFSAYPGKGLHVRSNSRTAFLRVLKLIKGQAKESLTSLGQSEEFAYVRTLMPADAPEEDGLIYLSDPFIRRLVGPELKLTELRRLKCFNNLRMISHAATMYEIEQGHRPKSLRDLEATNCLPDGFNKAALKCQCGGEYSLSHGKGVCSHHGHSDALVPCCEIPETTVTASEADAYQQFVTDYSQYWRTFFDPIAVRVQTTPERYRLETIVLPLINNSMYQSMAMALSGEPQQLSGHVTSDAILSVNFAIAKQRILEYYGWQTPPELAQEEPKEMPVGVAMFTSKQHLKQIGLAIHNYHDTYNQFPTDSKNESGGPLLSWRVHLLPFLENAALYKEFHLDEPWDSEHNKTMIDRMPEVFRSPGVKSSNLGMTTYQTVMGERMLFEPNGGKVCMQDVTDGISNTVMALDASSEFETTWTKPGDLMPDPAMMRTALHDRFQNGGLVLMGDGSVRNLVEKIDDAMLMNLFVRNDSQVIGDVFDDFAQQAAMQRGGPSHRNFGGRIQERDLYTFIAKGLGNRIGLQICDNDPTFDVQMTSILPEMFGSGRAGGMFSRETLLIGMAVASLNAPVYIDVAVEDVTIVDAFLEKLDESWAIEARAQTDLGWFALKKDFYILQADDTKVRSFVLSLGPFKWRLFQCRIGKNVCFSNKLQTLERIAAEHAANAVNPEQRKVTSSPAHAQVTIHREQWKHILPSMRLSWDEAARNACLDNIGPLTSAARVAASSHHDVADVTPEQLAVSASTIYGGVHRCPCGGRYTYTKDGKVVCDVHGNAHHPQQPAPDAGNGGSLEMLNSFSEIRVLLTFLEDGLHAVLEVDRR